MQSLTLISATNFAVLQPSIPVFTMLLSVVFRMERLTPLKVRGGGRGKGLGGWDESRQAGRQPSFRPTERPNYLLICLFYTHFTSLHFTTPPQVLGLAAAVAGAVCVEVVGPDTSFGSGSKADFVYGNVVVILQVGE